MIPIGLLVVLSCGVGLIGLGIAYILRPQLMFRVYNFPAGGSSDHLTAHGERTYRRHGIGIIALGVFVLLSVILVTQ